MIPKPQNITRVVTSQYKISTWSDVMSLIWEICLLLVNIFFAILEAVYQLIVPIPEKSIEGEIVLITGAGHGIGKELALQYAALNALVVCVDINEHTNKETVAEITKNGKTAYSYSCDITNRVKVMETIAKIQKDIGDITILVNNAGILLAHSFLEHTKEELEKTMNTNVMSHFWIIQAILPSMLKNNYGHIVGTSSCAGLLTLGNLVPYCTSKYAVRGMMLSLRKELQFTLKSQIKVTIVYPLVVDTGLAHTIRMRFAIQKRISPIKAAKDIISAQRRNKLEVTIPRYTLTIVLLLLYLPNKVQDLVMEFLGYHFESDL